MAGKRRAKATQVPMFERDLTRDMPALSFRAEVRPGSVNPEKRTVDVIWTTGARVLRGGWFTEKFWEELSLDPKHVRMERLNNGAPLLNAHDSYDARTVLGVVESARLEDGKGVATVRFARAEDDPEADVVFRKVKDGILQNASVGYRTHRLEKVEDGADKIPVMRATDWEPYEISVVPMGADDGAGFRAAEPRGPTNACRFVLPAPQQPTEEKRNMPDTTTAAPATTTGAAARTTSIEETTRQVSETRAREAGERAAELQRERDAAVATEQKRASTIRAEVRSHKLPDELAERAVSGNWSIEETRKAILDLLGDRSADVTDGHLRFEPGDDARDKFIRGGVASILDRAGQAELVERGREVKRLSRQFDGVSTDPGEFRGMRLIDLARHALEMRGVSTRGLFGDVLVKRALEFRGDAGFNTISDFAVLLESAMNKVFLGAYAVADVTWPRWAARKAVNDFRTSTFYRPGAFGVLDTVTEAGEIKHKNIPDGAKRTLTPATKGNIIGITRRAIVNDDLGAFRDLGANLGQAAALSIETDAFALITANSGLGVSYDANPLFHSSRSNIGPTGAMSVTTLDGARAIMAKQKDPNAAQYLAIRPAVWLGPVELSGQAKVFNTSTADPTDNKNSNVANRVMNLVRDVVDSPFLSASSTTRHYLVADPATYPVFAVGFIDGNEAPRMESEQVFGYDGMQMKVVLDYGVAVLDFRGAVTCAGA